MNVLAQILIVAVAAEHLGFLVLEMFFWTSPVGLKIFNQKAEQAAGSKVLAGNQGLYNGFLTVFLLWGLLAHKTDVCIVALLCVIAAGIYGGATVNRKVYLIQAFPGLVALLAVFA